MKQTDIRALVESWPGVGSDVKWGHDLVFSVASKMFCAMEASGVEGLSFKVEAERFLELTDRPSFAPARGQHAVSPRQGTEAADPAQLRLGARKTSKEDAT